VTLEHALKRAGHVSKEHRLNTTDLRTTAQDPVFRTPRSKRHHILRCPRHAAMRSVAFLKRPRHVSGVVRGLNRHLSATTSRRAPWKDHHHPLRVEDVDILSLAKNKQHSLSLADLVK
jgi:hypothetical protein